MCNASNRWNFFCSKYSRYYYIVATWMLLPTCTILRKQSTIHFQNLSTIKSATFTQLIDDPLISSAHPLIVMTLKNQGHGKNICNLSTNQVVSSRFTSTVRTLIIRTYGIKRLYVVITEDVFFLSLSFS